MSQGCLLPYSNGDRENFPVDAGSLDRDTVVRDFHETYGALASSPRLDERLVTDDLRLDRDRIAAAEIDRHTQDTFEKRMAGLNEEDRNFVCGVLAVKTDRQRDLILGLGNPELHEDVAAALPGALRRVLEKHPEAVGLFEPAGPGASAWVSTLKNTGVNNNANGCAWEVLATARLMSKPAGELRVFDGDRIAFGWKAQAHYGSRRGSLIVNDGETAGFFHQPDRGTTEADLLIRRPDGDLLAVDFKYGSGTRRVEKSELEGLVVALKTDEIQQAHLVCNHGFHAETWRVTQELNRELLELGLAKIELHENYR